jgi:hypothetical protein
MVGDGVNNARPWPGPMSEWPSARPTQVEVYDGGGGSTTFGYDAQRGRETPGSWVNS